MPLYTPSAPPPELAPSAQPFCPPTNAICTRRAACHRSSVQSPLPACAAEATCLSLTAACGCRDTRSAREDSTGGADWRSPAACAVILAPTSCRHHFAAVFMSRIWRLWCENARYAYVCSTCAAYGIFGHKHHHQGQCAKIRMNERVGQGGWEHAAVGGLAMDSCMCESKETQQRQQRDSKDGGGWDWAGLGGRPPRLSPRCGADTQRRAGLARGKRPQTI